MTGGGRRKDVGRSASGVRRHVVVRRHPFFAGLFLAILAVRSPAENPPSRFDSLLDGSKDEIVARTVVPSPERRVGEVRLVKRGGTSVVQTLLYTQVLKRVVGEIRKKEEANWPEGKDGHADAERYLDALSKAQAQIWDRMPKFDRSADPHQKLLIEFILNAESALVELAEYDMKESAGEMHVTSRRPIAELPLSRSYIAKNMRLIVADSFELSESKADELLIKAMGKLPE